MEKNHYDPEFVKKIERSRASKGTVIKDLHVFMAGISSSKRGGKK